MGIPRPKWPESIQGWTGFFFTLGSVIFASMTVSVSLLGLDTEAERELADAAIMAVHEADMGRLDEVELATWCILWEVPAETCRVAFENSHLGQAP